jgi:drug/metabolite transporter (DMT)-like permease
MWGASLVGAVLIAPVMLGTGHWFALSPFGTAEQALLALSVISALAYAGYVWLVAQAGPVFAVQVSYVVTICGVLWSLVILGERYPGGVWFALLFMLVGMALVQPRAAKA